MLLAAQSWINSEMLLVICKNKDLVAVYIEHFRAKPTQHFILPQMYFIFRQLPVLYSYTSHCTVNQSLKHFCRYK